jgi:hypothetical protein
MIPSGKEDNSPLFWSAPDRIISLLSFASGCSMVKTVLLFSFIMVDRSIPLLSPS